MYDLALAKTQIQNAGIAWWSLDFLSGYPFALGIQCEPSLVKAKFGAYFSYLPPLLSHLKPWLFMPKAEPLSSLPACHGARFGKQHRESCDGLVSIAPIKH